MKKKILIEWDEKLFRIDLFNQKLEWREMLAALLRAIICINDSTEIIPGTTQLKSVREVKKNDRKTH